MKKIDQSKIFGIIDRIPKDGKNVIVFDIDNTLLSNDGEPLHHNISLYSYVVKKGLTPVIITARPGYHHNIIWTQRQLHQHGIKHYKYIYFRPLDKDDLRNYKLYARKDLHLRGYKVAMSIGDMPWDVGQYGGIGVIV